MIRTATLVVFFAFSLVAGCDGPRENAGEVADARAGVAPADNGFAKGPGEALGEAEDRAVASARQATEAHADAVEDQADIVRRAADQKADVLEDQARSLRKAAERKADAVELRTDALRDEP